MKRRNSDCLKSQFGSRLADSKARKRDGIGGGLVAPKPYEKFRRTGAGGSSPKGGLSRLHLYGTTSMDSLLAI